MTVDRRLISRKGSLIKRDLDRLGKLAKISKKDYLETYEVQLQVERLLERVVGRL